LKAWTANPRVIITAPVSVVRERAATGATPVTDVVIGGLLRTEGAEGAWIKVALPDGRRGYIKSEDTQGFEAWTAATHPVAGNIEKTALQFMGTPYLWGGTSSKGFDCSGYVKTVLRLNGMEMPRDTDQQAEQGTAVSIDSGFDQLRKGDLLFFGTRAAAGRLERISHVGIYVGDGEFLHASGLVRRNSLLPTSPIYSESLRNRLLRVRRVLK
jgi:cell wall-associated NlpC family hydrolase